jgi:iron complex transport system substrate-binding protein
MSSPSPLSMPVALEKFLPKIASAVDGTPAQ